MEKQQIFSIITIVVLVLGLAILPWWSMTTSSKMDFFGETMEMEGKQSVGILRSKVTLEMGGAEESNTTSLGDYKDNVTGFGEGPGGKLVIVAVLVIVTLVVAILALVFSFLSFDKSMLLAGILSFVVLGLALLSAIMHVSAIN